MSSGTNSTRGGVIFKVIVVMVVIAAALALAWMLFLPAGVAREVSRRSGFPTALNQLAFNPVSGGFSGSGLAIDNPPARGGSVFLRIGDFSGRADMGSLSAEEWVIDDLRVELDLLVIVVDAEGTTNAEAFGEAFAAVLPTNDPANAPRYATAGFPIMGDGPKSLLIRRLHLDIGRVELIQSDPRFPRQLAEQLDFSANYENVRRVEDLLSAALLQRLAQSPNLWQALLQHGALPGLEDKDGRLRQLWQKAGDALNSLFRTLEQ